MFPQVHVNLIMDKMLVQYTVWSTCASQCEPVCVNDCPYACVSLSDLV